MKSTPRIYGLTPRYVGDEIVRWSVAVMRRGERFAREFSAVDYGGAEGAKTAAIAFRDDVLRRVPAMSLREFSSIVRSNNTSGVPGVHRRVHKGFAFWYALVNLPNGKSRKRTFAIKKYGEERAKQLAIEARVELLEFLDGWLVQHPDGIPADQAPPQPETCAPRPPKPRAKSAGPKLSADKRIYRMEWKRTLADGQEGRYQYWIAEYSTKGQPVRRKSFAVAQYGEDEARRLAVEQRRAWLAHPPAPSRSRASRPSTESRTAAVSGATPAGSADPVPTSAHPEAHLR